MAVAGAAIPNQTEEGETVFAKIPQNNKNNEISEGRQSPIKYL